MSADYLVSPAGDFIARLPSSEAVGGGLSPNLLRMKFGSTQNGYVLTVNDEAEGRDLSAARAISSARLALDALLVVADTRYEQESRSSAARALAASLSEEVRLEILEIVCRFEMPPAWGKGLREFLDRAVERGVSNEVSELLAEILELNAVAGQTRHLWTKCVIDLALDPDVSNDLSEAMHTEHIWAGLTRAIARGHDSGSLLMQMLAIPNQTVGTATLREVSAWWQVRVAPNVDRESQLPDEQVDVLDPTASQLARRKGAFDYSRITRQQEAILTALRRNRRGQYRKYLLELIEYHRLTTSDAATAKTLSKLSSQAQSLGQFEAAIDLGRMALEYKADDGVAWGQLALAYTRCGRLDPAIVALDRAEEFGGWLGAVALRACIFARQGREELAFELLESMTVRVPESLYFAATAYRLLGEPSEALRIYDELQGWEGLAERLDPGRAEALVAVGRWDEATDLAERILRSNDSVVACVSAASALVRMGQLARSSVVLEELVRKYPMVSVVHVALADLASVEGRMQDAVSHTGRAIELAKGNVVVANRHAEALRQSGNLAQALAQYESNIAMFDSELYAMNGRAETLKALGRFDDAVEAYEKTLSRHPSDPYAWNGKANCLLSIGKLDEAAFMYAEAIDRWPRNEVPYSGLAEVAKRRGDLATALNVYAQADLRIANSGSLRNGRASVLATMNELDAALSLYRKSDPSKGVDPYAICGEMDVLLRMGRVDDAHIVALRAVKDHRGDPNVLSVASRVFFAAGEEELGWSHLNRVLRERPLDTYALVAQADAHRRFGNAEDSVSALTALVGRDPQSFHAWRCLGAAHKASGDLSRAKDVFSEAARLLPGAKYFRSQLVAVNALLGEAEFVATEEVVEWEPASDEELTGKLVMEIVSAKRGDWAKFESGTALGSRGSAELQQGLLPLCKALQPLRSGRFVEADSVLNDCSGPEFSHVAALFKWHSRFEATGVSSPVDQKAHRKLAAVAGTAGWDASIDRLQRSSSTQRLDLGLDLMLLAA